MIFLSDLIHLNAKAKYRLNDNYLQKHLRNTERWLIRHVFSRIQKKGNMKCRKGDMKKQNKKGRIKVQNIQLEGNLSHKDMKLNAFQCATSAREATNMAMSCVVMTVKFLIMNYGLQDITDSEDGDTLVCHICYK